MYKNRVNLVSKYLQLKTVSLIRRNDREAEELLYVSKNRVTLLLKIIYVLSFLPRGVSKTK